LDFYFKSSKFNPIVGALKGLNL